MSGLSQALDLMIKQQSGNIIPGGNSNSYSIDIVNKFMFTVDEDGKYHSYGDNPAIIYMDNSINIWAKHGIIHRTNLNNDNSNTPAICYSDKKKIYYKNGLLHNDTIGNLSNEGFYDELKLYYWKGESYTYCNKNLLSKIINYDYLNIEKKNYLILSILKINYNDLLNYFPNDEYYNFFDEMCEAYDDLSRCKNYIGNIAYYINNNIIDVKNIPLDNNYYTGETYINFKLCENFLENLINISNINTKDKIINIINNIIKYILNDNYINKIMKKNNMNINLLLDILNLIKNNNNNELLEEKIKVTILEQFGILFLWGDNGSNKKAIAKGKGDGKVKENVKVKKTAIGKAILQAKIFIDNKEIKTKFDIQNHFPLLTKLNYFENKKINNINIFFCKKCNNSINDYYLSSTNKIYCYKCKDFIEIEIIE